MAEYNLPNEKGRSRFELYEGSNVKQMPKLIADGRVPMNVAQIMQRRLDLRNSDDKIKTQWMDNYFDTGDAVIYHPDGRVKIVLDSQTLRDMTPDTSRNYGALILTNDIYNSLEGEEFKKGKLGKTEDWLSKKDVKAHPIWKVLARDQALLNDYANYIFAEGKERFDYGNMMGIYPGSCNGDNPEMRAWCVNWLEYRSFAYGRSSLDYYSGRFVGIAPEALGAPAKGASNINLALNTKMAKNLEKIAEIVGGHSLEEVRRALNPEIVSVAQILENTNQISAYAPDQIKKLQNILEQNGYTITKR